MKTYVKVYCGAREHVREIDSEGRIILGHIGNQEPIYRTLRRRIKGDSQDEKIEDIKKIFRLIDVEPIESIEFIEE